MNALCGMTLEEIQGLCQEHGQPKFRAKQLCEWIYQKRVASFDDMTTLPKLWRRQLAEAAAVTTCRVRGEQRSADGTAKLLVGLHDGEAVETVVIPDARRRTVCVSTQVGCAMQCAFCASGADGLVRNLSAGEIVGQLLLVQAALPPRERISNVVYMGMGEPLANYDAVLKSIRIANAQWALGIAARRITVSTVGLPGQIRRLAGEDLQITLAISLHVAGESKRQELLPVAGKIPLADVLAAARDYFAKTGREVTLEYALLDGINCTAHDAHLLADLLEGIRGNVNLIPFNAVPGGAFRPPSNATVAAFVAALESRGVNVNLRRRRGAEIDGACGQLRQRKRKGAEAQTREDG